MGMGMGMGKKMSLFFVSLTPPPAPPRPPPPSAPLPAARPRAAAPPSPRHGGRAVGQRPQRHRLDDSGYALYRAELLQLLRELPLQGPQQQHDGSDGGAAAAALAAPLHPWLADAGGGQWSARRSRLRRCFTSSAAFSASFCRAKSRALAPR